MSRPTVRTRRPPAPEEPVGRRRQSRPNLAGQVIRALLTQRIVLLAVLIVVVVVVFMLWAPTTT